MDQTPQGETEGVSDDDRLYRLILPDWINADGSIKSAAYHERKREDGFHHISVFWERHASPEAVLAYVHGLGAMWANHGLGVVAASVPRSLELTIQHTPEEGHAAHCDIVGNVTKSRARELAKKTTILIPPPSGDKASA